MSGHWRSLRAQVLLWTALPLTILLIAVSLTGVGTHQASMRILAVEDNTQLAAAIASALEQQIDTYVTGLSAAARLMAHHARDSATRTSLLDETSAVLGDVAIVELDGRGGVHAGSGAVPPLWAADLPPFTASAHGVAVVGNTVLIRVDLPGQDGALVAGVPLTQFAPALERVATERASLQIELAGPGESALLVAGSAPAPDSGAADHQEHSGGDWIVTAAPVAGTPWNVTLREPWHTRTLPLIRFEQAMPFVLVVAAAVSFLTLYFGLRLVVRPLRQLEARARRIGEGDFAAAAEPVGGVDEIENVRAAMDQMAGRLQDSQRALERYLYATTQAQEEERARLARELHDDTVQGLIALDHRLQKAQRTLQRDPGLLRDEVTDLRQMVRRALEEVRRFSRALRPVYLEDLGLCPALELLAGEAGVGYSMTGEQRRLDPAVELAFYRIAQESINNARRHAQAACIEVSLAFTPSTVTMAVRDDGIGFTPPAHLGSLSRAGHFGLMSIQERAELIGAQLMIESVPGQGTVVTVTQSA